MEVVEVKDLGEVNEGRAWIEQDGKVDLNE